MTLELVDKPADWRKMLDSCRAKGQQVGLVPTMGALHAGHMSLIRRAAAECDVVAVTDYVNPLQFGAGEDYASYPRDIDRDYRIARESGASVVFAPSVEQMWPEPPSTRISVAELTEILEGASRPGHFDGVTTIVARLFALAGPCWAYFGEKDYQQLAVVRRMVRDLALPVEIVACPTVRETDGLAMSSRNSYMSADERGAAPQIYYALLAGKRAIEDDGIDDPAVVQKVIAESLASRPHFDLDYAAAVDPETLQTPRRIAGEVRLLIAARVGRARLIDNVPATPPAANPG